MEKEKPTQKSLHQKGPTGGLEAGYSTGGRLLALIANRITRRSFLHRAGVAVLAVSAAGIMPLRKVEASHCHGAGPEPETMLCRDCSGTGNSCPSYPWYLGGCWYTCPSDRQVQCWTGCSTPYARVFQDCIYKSCTQYCKDGRCTCTRCGQTKYWCYAYRGVYDIQDPNDRNFCVVTSCGHYTC